MRSRADFYGRQDPGDLNSSKAAAAAANLWQIKVPIAEEGHKPAVDPDGRFRPPVFYVLITRATMRNTTAGRK